MLEFQGSSLFRHHIVCSLLSKRPIRITHIHDEEEQLRPTPQELSDSVSNFFNSNGRDTNRPSSASTTKRTVGLQVHEVNFLKLIARLTSGTTMSTSDNNTTLVFHPGMIVGGTFTHVLPASPPIAPPASASSGGHGYGDRSEEFPVEEVDHRSMYASTSQRAVTYLIEAALLILPFAKYDTRLRLEGATQGAWDLSVDTVRTVTLRWLQLFGVTAQLRVVRRGAPPGGGGVVELEVRSLRRLQSVLICAGPSSSVSSGAEKGGNSHRGRVRRVRGIAFASRTAGDLPQRAATAAKGVLLNLLPDVYVVTDTDRGAGKRVRSAGAGADNEEEEEEAPAPQGTPSAKTACSGYGIVLVADTTSPSCVLSQETVARPGESPEEVGERCARLLLDEVLEGGAVDRHHQLFVLMLMALGPDEISTVRFGAQLTPSAISGLILMEKYFGVKCAIKNEDSFAGPDFPPSTLVTCMGSNVINVSKKSS